LGLCEERLLCRTFAQPGVGIRERATELGLPDPLCISAFSGSAAEQIFGQTIHSLYGLDVGVPFSESVGPKRKLTLETRLGNKWYHFFDERSMISQIMWGWIIARMRVACPERKDLKFSGRSVVLFGDDCQLPPPNGGRVFTSSSEPYRFGAAWHRLRTRSQTRVQTAPSHSK
jgi:hypothetical protein